MPFSYTSYCYKTFIIYTHIYIHIYTYRKLRNILYFLKMENETRYAISDVKEKKITIIMLSYKKCLVGVI